MDRYKRLYSIGNNLYQKDSPIIIDAGVLLLDTKNDKVIAQLKFRNIKKQSIRALQVNLENYDIGGEKLEGIKDFQYLDINVQIGETFGTKTPIYMPSKNVRSYVVKTVIVFFENGKKWVSGPEWKELPPPIKKEGTTEFLKQYKQELGNKAEYIFEETEKLWQCACGSYNDNSVETCYGCNLKKDDIKRMTDDIVNANMQKRLAEQEEERKRQLIREEEERLKKEEEQEREKEKKLQQTQRIKKNCIILGSTIALALAVFLVYTILEPIVNEKRAENAVENNDYEKAVIIYKGLNKNGDYDDEIEKYNRIICYQKALVAIEGGKHKKAMDLLKELPRNYSDTADLLQKCVLNYGEELYLQAKYEECIEMLNNNKATSSDIYRKVCYQLGLQKMNEEDWEKAISYFENCREYEDSNQNIQTCQRGIIYNEAVWNMKQGELSEAINKLNNLPSDFKETLRYMDLCKQYRKYEREWICKTYRITHGHNGKTYNLDDSAKNENIKSTAKLSEDGTMKIYFDECVATLNGSVVTWNKWGDVPNTFNMSTGSRVMQFYNGNGTKSDTYTYTYVVN